MATPEAIATLRRMADEPTTDPYTDEVLSALLDSKESPEQAASAIWREKAARASTLVDVSESGSSRSLRQIFSNAEKMAEYYDNAGKVDVPVVDTSASPFTTAVTRM